MKTWVVGLTGGIGSGKSAAADEFAKLGATIVDTDAIAHELTQQRGAAIPEGATIFGLYPPGAEAKEAFRTWHAARAKSQGKSS